MFRELVAALHLHIVSGTLGFVPECQVPLVLVLCADSVRVRTRSLCAAPLPHDWVHAVAPSLRALRPSSETA